MFTISNGSVFDIAKTSDLTDYLSANQSCQAKNGYLAIIDSSFKQDIIEELIRQHLSNYSLQKASYLIGKYYRFKRKQVVIILSTIKPFKTDVIALGLRRENGIWTYSNSKPLGVFMNWAVR